AGRCTEMNPAEIVRTVRNFIRWHSERFDALDEAHEAIANPVGHRRGQGDKREFWIKPEVWRDIFDNEPDAAVDAARALREIGLLRVQDTENCQAVVEVRKKSVRAYVVKAKILEREAVESYGAYGPPGIAPRRNSTPFNPVSPSVIPLQPPDGPPPALSTLLHDGTRLGLQRAIELLATSPHPSDRNYAAQLRGQTALINTLVSVQARIDEVQLKEK